MVRHFDVAMVLERARRALEKGGVKSKILGYRTDSEKRLEIKCCNLNRGEIRPVEIVESAITLLDNKGYNGKKEVSFDGKKVSFSSTAVTAMREYFEPSVVTSYPNL